MAQAIVKKKISKKMTKKKGVWAAKKLVRKELPPSPQFSHSPRSQKERMRKVLKILKDEFPEAKCSLFYSNPFQLLVATILSAQCTDEKVNQVTPVLFSRFPDARSLARATLVEIEKIVRPTGFYKNKAFALKEMSEEVDFLYNGEVPQTMEQLIKLRGVGRKTANVVLGNAYGINKGVVVDTHVGRIARRLGFSEHTDPVKVELDLLEVIPKRDWTLFSHLLIYHGRKTCTSRKAYCERCPLLKQCERVGV
jgi:endonuclease III